MPTYEYKCDKCGKVFEEYQSFQDKALTQCKFCKGPVKKVFYPAGIVFKGTGFHVTDYKSKHTSSDISPSHKKDSEVPKVTSSDPTKSPEKSETKTATSK